MTLEVASEIQTLYDFASCCPSCWINCDTFGSMMLLFIVVVAREFPTHQTLKAEFVVQHVWWIVHHLAIDLV